MILVGYGIGSEDSQCNFSRQMLLNRVRPLNAYRPDIVDVSTYKRSVCENIISRASKWVYTKWDAELPCLNGETSTNIKFAIGIKKLKFTLVTKVSTDNLA